MQDFHIAMTEVREAIDQIEYALAERNFKTSEDVEHALNRLGELQAELNRKLEKHGIFGYLQVAPYYIGTPPA